MYQTIFGVCLGHFVSCCSQAYFSLHDLCMICKHIQVGAHTFRQVIYTDHIEALFHYIPSAYVFYYLCLYDLVWPALSLTKSAEC